MTYRPTISKPSNNVKYASAMPGSFSASAAAGMLQATPDTSFVTEIGSGYRIEYNLEFNATADTKGFDFKIDGVTLASMVPTVVNGKSGVVYFTVIKKDDTYCRWLFELNVAGQTWNFVSSTDEPIANFIKPLLPITMVSTGVGTVSPIGTTQYELTKLA